MRDRYVIAVSLPRDLIDTLKKLKEHNTNLSRFVESAIREYLSRPRENSNAKQSPIDLGKYAVVEKDQFFMNVCRKLILYAPGEWTRLRIDTDFKNAIALAYKICRKHFTPSLAPEEEQEEEQEEASS